MKITIREHVVFDPGIPKRSAVAGRVFGCGMDDTTVNKHILQRTRCSDR